MYTPPNLNESASRLTAAIHSRRPLAPRRCDP
jgi:hypothetical protein